MIYFRCYSKFRLCSSLSGLLIGMWLETHKYVLSKKQNCISFSISIVQEAFIRLDSHQTFPLRDHESKVNQLFTLTCFYYIGFSSFKRSSKYFKSKNNYISKSQHPTQECMFLSKYKIFWTQHMCIYLPNTEVKSKQTLTTILTFQRSIIDRSRHVRARTWNQKMS